MGGLRGKELRTKGRVPAARSEVLEIIDLIQQRGAN